MQRIDLIIDALSFAQNSVWSKLNEQALAAARELQALAQPEQEPKLTDAGADTNIVRGLEPKGSGWVTLNQPIAMHVCNLWINPETFFYEVDRGTHPINEVIPVYTAPPKRQWVGMTSEDWENTPDTGKQGCERDVEIFDWIEQTLKEKNT